MRYRVPTLLLVLAALLTHGVASAAVIPPERQGDWPYAGLGGPPPLPDTILDIRDYGAVGDGVTDDRAAIAAAIAALGGASGVVWLPPGTWLIRSGLSLPSGVVLRGAGATETTLRCDRGGVAADCLTVAGRSAGAFRPVLSGFARGETTLVLADATDLVPGDWVELRQENGAWDVAPADWATYAVGQFVRVAAVDGDAVVLEHPLRVELDPALNPELRGMVPATDVGIEALRIVRVDEPASGAGHNIQFSLAAFGWVAGVESDHSVGSHVMIGRSSNIEVSGCYFHDAFTFDGAGTRGYGVTLNDRAGECLIENNVFRNLRHAMMTKKGANGNVFAYNYSIEPHRSETINDASGDISLHGHWSSANLFEGNVVQNVIIDHYWGPSGPYNAFFRNRVEWFGIILTQGTPQTADQAFVGNEIPEHGYNLLIQIGWGLYYQLRGPGHLAYGNDVDGTIEPSGTGDLADVSYYRAPEDDWCELAPGWPTLGPPNGLDTGTIRARDRYLAGGDVTYRQLQLEMPADVAIEWGDAARLAAEAVGGVGALAAAWSPEDGLDDPASFAPSAAPDADTTYTLTVTDGAGCHVSGEVSVAVAGGPIDECATGAHDCAPDADCANTTGGYTCACRDGFAGDGQTCADVDECTTGAHDCAPDADCANTTGGYTCACRDGFEGDGQTCADIDECATGAHDCAPDADCANTTGGYTCACRDGFAGDGQTCADVDECTTGAHDCAPDADCANTAGAYTCACRDGFEGDGQTCADVDECTTGAHDCAPDADCANTTGGYTCACHDGFAGDGRICDDIDECAGGDDDCAPDADCTNVHGSFLCDCRAGFEGNGRACEDVNECATGDHDCAPDADCANTTGGYTCACHDGFQGDGWTCAPIAVVEPAPDVVEPAPDVVEPAPDVVEPTPDVVTPPLDVVTPPPDIVEIVTPPADTVAPPADTATPPADTATPPADTATPPADTVTPPADTVAPPADTATPPADTATPPPDTATPPPDTATPPPDIVEIVTPPPDAAPPPPDVVETVTPPPEDTAGIEIAPLDAGASADADAGVSGAGTGSGSCQSGGDAPAPAAPLILLLLVALAAGAVRRRRGPGVRPPR